MTIVGDASSTGLLVAFVLVDEHGLRGALWKCATGCEFIWVVSTQDSSGASACRKGTNRAFMSPGSCLRAAKSFENVDWCEIAMVAPLHMGSARALEATLIGAHHTLVAAGSRLRIRQAE